MRTNKNQNKSKRNKTRQNKTKKNKIRQNKSKRGAGLTDKLVKNTIPIIKNIGHELAKDQMQNILKTKLKGKDILHDRPKIKINPIYNIPSPAFQNISKNLSNDSRDFHFSRDDNDKENNYSFMPRKNQFGI